MESNRPDPDPAPGNEPTTFNLLFVCSGNTCRSPMARAIAESMLRARGWGHVRVESAGTSAVHGAPASMNAATVARERDLDLSKHQSQPLTPDLLAWADAVLAMSPAHVAHSLRLDAHARVSLITEYLEGGDPGTAVRDPFGGDLETYRQTFDQIYEAVGAVLDRLERILAP